VSWTLCASGAAISLAGKNANTTCQSGANFDKWSDWAEGQVCQEINCDAITSFANFEAPTQNAISLVTACKVARLIVCYDPNAYGNRTAETILDNIDELESKGLSRLKESVTNTLKQK
jgi:hypothetical protein